MDTIKDDKEIVSQVYGLFDEFRGAYASEWERLDMCERMYMGKHWEDSDDPREPQPVTPVIQSTIENIAADLMDNYPDAIITPEDAGGEETERIARVVEALIQQNHDAASYLREYRKLAHDLLTGGYMVQEVGYDPDLNNGLGGAFIRHVDARNCMFDPLCSDIQDGRAVIKFEGLPRKVMEQRYGMIFDNDPYTPQVVQDDPSITKDATKMVLLIEYWWREYANGRHRVHMCKVAGGQVIEDSRKSKPDGYFAHGEYPFIVTPLFLRKGSALGWGMVDMFKDRQQVADKLDQFLLKNAYTASRNKILVTEQSGFDETDLADWTKDVHVGRVLDGVKWFATPPLPDYLFAYIQNIRQGMKEESGANDFSRGNVGGGVTAASAIAALQEMSSKRSRMAAGQMHEAYKDAVRLEIEVEREYNILPREVVVTIDGQRYRDTFESAMLQRTTALGNSVPMEFMISIKVQRENRWSVMAQNELILQMVQMQILRPDQAVELMHFEGKEGVLQRATSQEENPEEMQQMQAEQEMMNQMQQLPAPEQALV